MIDHLLDPLRKKELIKNLREAARRQANGGNALQIELDNSYRQWERYEQKLRQHSPNNPPSPQTLKNFEEAQLNNVIAQQLMKDLDEPQEVRDHNLRVICYYLGIDFFGDYDYREVPPIKPPPPEYGL